MGVVIVHEQDQDSMNSESLEAAAALVPYIKQGKEAKRSHEKQIQILLEQVDSISYMFYIVGMQQ